ncbi:hypothetical protein L3X38_038334 [Prunus dulcis]|uniref:Phorbol-ester/DAG-type domain-containing protein n=1 Tax=Prunus dulcis TaxID=3755 RepID=A0AAD4V6B8_PRUDU|nr:hypothetical protein L3X38_038334 [Prunus dulcis]
MELQHFSHKHPLTYKEEQKKEDGRLVFCNACGDPVLGPSYTCNKYPPGFTLHKSCAELPREIEHPLHRKHPLVLLTPTKYTCAACDQRYKASLAYNCSLCHFNLDLKCASNWQNIIENDRHEHTFTIFRKRIKFNCDACGSYGNGIPYFCSICQLLVHKRCTPSLPRDIKITGHQHSLMLTWSLEEIRRSNPFCKVCYTSMKKHRAIYSCQCCGYVAHTKCATHESFRDVTTTDIVEDQSKNMILGASQQINMVEYQRELAEHQIKHFSHQHLLALNDEVKDEDNKSRTCDGCIGPITNAYYSCTENESCHFFLHKTCAQLPTKLLHPLHPLPLTLLPWAPSTDRVFWCHLCRNLCQGFAYYCSKFDLYFDLECISLSESLTHEFYEDRLFFNRSWEKYYNYCHGCDTSIGETFARFSSLTSNGYHDIFNFCIQCVKVPLTAKHRYDDHPLKLIFKRDGYCEICEGKQHKGEWLYSCEDCDFDCHTYCILGRYPKVKLGSTFKISAHPHLVTLIDKRKSVIPFDKRSSILPCQLCGGPCEGLVFECSKCHVNIHRSELYCIGRENELNKLQRPCIFTELQPNQYGRLVFCNMCGDPVVGPGYNGNKDPPNLTVHKSCAKLPREIQHPMHRKHPLILRKPRYYSMIKCDVCSQRVETTILTLVPNVTSTLTSNVLPIGETLEIMTAVTTNSPSFGSE